LGPAPGLRTEQSTAKPKNAGGDGVEHDGRGNDEYEIAHRAEWIHPAVYMPPIASAAVAPRDDSEIDPAGWNRKAEPEINRRWHALALSQRAGYRRALLVGEAGMDVGRQTVEEPIAGPDGRNVAVRHDSSSALRVIETSLIPINLEFTHKLLNSTV